MVVLEALSHGMPVVCLDLGGPGVAVDESCGRVVRTAGRSEEEVIERLAAALHELGQVPAMRERLEGARARAVAFDWAKKVRRLNPRH